MLPFVLYIMLVMQNMDHNMENTVLNMVRIDGGSRIHPYTVNLTQLDIFR